MSFGAGLIAPSSAATSAAAATAAATTGGLFLPVAAVAASVGLVTVSVNLLLQALARSKEEVVEVQSLEQAGLRMYEALGRGAFKTVDRAEFHGLAAAVKVTPSSTDLLEAKGLSSLPKCCFILRTQGCFLQCNQRFLVTELISGGELEQLLPLDLRQIHFYGASIILALQFLQSCHVSHGRLQAQLRVLANAELAKNVDKYKASHNLIKNIARSGYYAESRSLLALAHAANCDLRMWSWNISCARWDFYQLCPEKKRKHEAQIIYLQLKDEHYEWLKPISQISPAKAAAWLQTSRLQPDEDLRGGVSSAGSSHKPDAMSLLGLKGTVTTKRSKSASAKSLLGIKSKGTKKSHIKPQSSNRQKRVGEAKSEILDLPPDTYDYVSLYKCPCGWIPPTDGKNARGKSGIKTIADRRWHVCQGTTAPKIHSLEIKQLRARTVFRDHHSQQVEKAVTNYQKWQQELTKKDPKKAKALCEAQPGTCLYTEATRSRYICSRCGRVTRFCFFQKLKCPRSPIDISHMEWLRFSKGDAWVAKYQKANAESYARKIAWSQSKAKANKSKKNTRLCAKN